VLLAVLAVFCNRFIVSYAEANNLMKRCEIEYGRPPGPKNKHGCLLAGFAAQALSLDALAQKRVVQIRQSLLWVDLDFHWHRLHSQRKGHGLRVAGSFVFFVRDSVL
jgi:hypothetical protein